ncbi:hypothetical protein MATL_G00173740 [Megalops atlanticus]|uniref:Uncharacterized protein n=1 Tax=Megalops atlanticus TaxID=7932 RepID=A0A9D3T7D6_MEGAT|nr:hypothetical protein MATL_G00173740 [Megalops atlanticus]
MSIVITLISMKLKGKAPQGPDKTGTHKEKIMPKTVSHLQPKHRTNASSSAPARQEQEQKSKDSVSSRDWWHSLTRFLPTINQSPPQQNTPTRQVSSGMAGSDRSVPPSVSTGPSSHSVPVQEAAQLAQLPHTQRDWWYSLTRFLPTINQSPPQQNTPTHQVSSGMGKAPQRPGNIGTHKETIMPKSASSLQPKHRTNASSSPPTRQEQEQKPKDSVSSRDSWLSWTRFHPTINQSSPKDDTTTLKVSQRLETEDDEEEEPMESEAGPVEGEEPMAVDTDSKDDKEEESMESEAADGTRKIISGNDNPEASKHPKPSTGNRRDNKGSRKRGRGKEDEEEEEGEKGLSRGGDADSPSKKSKTK